MDSDRLKVEQGYEMVLEGLGIDWANDDHMCGTPRRAAKAMVDELCRGLNEIPPAMTSFPLTGRKEMVISRNIPVRSLCAHHLLPFTGTATVGYIPYNSVLGLSKLSRAVEYCARRPQVQEDLTTDIANLVMSAILPPDVYQSVRQDGTGGGTGWGVAVVVRARHFCMELRGIQHTSDVVTSALRGEFLSPEVRAEFMSLAEANGR